MSRIPRIAPFVFSFWTVWSACGGAHSTDETSGLPPADLKPLTDAERTRFHDLTQKLTVNGTPVAHCFTSGAQPACLVAGRYAERLLHSGYDDGQVLTLHQWRFDPKFFVRVASPTTPCRGPDGAPVTITVFSDFECGHCRRGHLLVKRIMDEHTHTIRECFRHFPLSFHKQARLAAEYAVAAAEQGKFWLWHDRVFEQQDKLSPKDLWSLGESLGMDMQSVSKAMRSQKPSKAVERDRSLGLELGIQGTPTFFINGRFYATDPRHMSVYIEEERFMAEEN